MNRYIKFENAGDQFVGRCVSGLTRLSKDFAASQAYFDFSTCSRLDKEQHEREIYSWIKARMPETNDKVFALFKMCVGAIAHQRQFLEDHLHTESKLRTNVFLIDTIPFAEFVTVAYPWNKTSDTPKISGIPTDILILAEFEDMRIQFEDMRHHFQQMEISLKQHFNETLTKELNSRDVGGAAFSQMSLMMEKMEKMMNMIETGSLPSINANENNTNEVVEELVREIEYDEFYCEDDEDDVELPLDIDEGTREQLNAERTQSLLKARVYTLGNHHGKLNPLPPMWRYPNKITLIDLINLWLLGGGKQQNVPPLFNAHPACVLHFDTKGRKYSKFKQVMRLVKQFGIKREVWLVTSRTKLWNGAGVTALWNAIWEDFVPFMRTKTKLSTGLISIHKSRTGESAAITIYNNIAKAGLLHGNRGI
jgi:hypothetical protein